jgi:hypothetical protein
MDETAKHERRLLDRVTIEARTLRPMIVVYWEAVTIAADQSTDQDVRQELIEAKAKLGDVLAAIADWEQLARRDYVPADDDGEIDPDAAQDARDQREYERGQGDARRLLAERKIYGNELAEAFDVQSELNDYNAGDE